MSSWIPNFCTLKRDSSNIEFGFSLASNNGMHKVIEITANSIAHLAGLRNDDKILEVNGKSVVNTDLEFVVRKMGENPNQITMLVVADFDMYTACNQTNKFCHLISSKNCSFLILFFFSRARVR